MSAVRIYSEKTVAEVRAAVKRGEPIRAIAERLGMSPSTVSNMSRNRIYRPEEDVRAERAERARRVSALGGEAVRRQHAEQRPPVGAVAAAIAERSTGKPLVVETLEERLQKAIPGAYVVGGRPCDSTNEPWAVWTKHARLSTAASKREAVDKAIALFGGQR